MAAPARRAMASLLSEPGDGQVIPRGAPPQAGHGRLDRAGLRRAVARSRRSAGRNESGPQRMESIMPRQSGSRLAVERDVTAEQRLNNEVRDHAAIVRVHPRTVGVEDPCDLDRQIVLPTVIEEQGFGATLALVVAGARTDRIDVPPIILGLRVNARDRHRPPRWTPAGSWLAGAWQVPAC